MKKLFVLLLALLVLVGCSSTANTPNDDVDKDDEPTLETIKVSATAEPHATILEFVETQLNELGYTLDIEILDNYYIFNSALDNGDVDANYFQHVPFFEGEVAENGYDIVNAGGIHIEPFGIYSPVYNDVSEIEEGATVVISNSVADHGRILAILDKAGVITLKEGYNPIDTTIDDIVENPLNLKFIEVNPEMTVSALENNEGGLIAINGNYAIAAGLNPVNDTLILEQADETNPYVNIVACKAGDENSDKIKALIKVLKSSETQKFILDTFGGSVIPAN